MTQSENIISSSSISSCSNIAVADLQGFFIEDFDNEFLVKELCFTILNNNDNNNEYHHYIFTPPFEWQDLSRKCRESALWLRSYHHGFSWNEGQLRYIDRIDYIQPLLQENLIILVKGRQKIQWLKEVCCNSKIDVRDIEDIFADEPGNYRLADEAYQLKNVHHCGMHRIVKHCAKQNVKIIESWLKEYEYKCKSTISTILSDDDC